MKKAGLILLVCSVASLAWMGFIREPLPPTPEIVDILSEEVPFHFSIHRMNYKSLELSLQEKIEGKGLYAKFTMANPWKTGRAGLVLNGVQATSNFRGGMSPKNYLEDEKRKSAKTKDFSDFMRDKKGKSVTSYSFKQTLLEGKSGAQFMLVSYAGSAMEMIQTLRIDRPVTLPAHISRKFVPKGIIQFQSGTVAFDRKSKGFHIPVKIR